MSFRLRLRLGFPFRCRADLGDGRRLGASCLLPGFARGARALARTTHFALGVLDPFARPLELLFGEPDALLGDIHAQSRARHRGGQLRVYFGCLAFRRRWGLLHDGYLM